MQRYSPDHGTLDPKIGLPPRIDQPKDLNRTNSRATNAFPRGMSEGMFQRMSVVHYGLQLSWNTAHTDYTNYDS